MDDATRMHRLDKLPHDCSVKVLAFLDHVSLLRQRCVNRAFGRIASENTVWEPLCQQLWKDKVHVSKQAQETLAKDAMAAYRLSIDDAKTREFGTTQELCFNPDTKRGTIWSIRFKEAAGPDWTSWDPWFQHQPCRKIVFLEDGRVRMFVPKEGTSDEMELSDPVWRSRPDPQHHGELEEPHAAMTWRFVEQPLDFSHRPLGSYIRLTVGGRDVPTYVCRRSPTGNWGFVMESCWGVMASFELPKRPKVDRHRRSRRRLRRAHNLEGNEIFVHVEVDDSSEDESDHENEMASESSLTRRNRNDWGGIRNEDLLVTEGSFNVTIALQWREAYLYNTGANALPEGKNAMEEFQRIYENAMDD